MDLTMIHQNHSELSGRELWAAAGDAVLAKPIKDNGPRCVDIAACVASPQAHVGCDPVDLHSCSCGWSCDQSFGGLCDDDRSEALR